MSQDTPNHTHLATQFPSAKALVENLATPTDVPIDSASVVATRSHHLYSDLPHHLLQADGTPDYLRLILTADVYDLVKQTALQPGINLSSKTGCTVLLKREDLQPVFSFKLRGAFNMMRQLDDEQKWKGVIACSAGNHAQGVAMAGAHLGIPCTIVMPSGTPSIKTENVERLGAKVVLHGQDFDDAKAECTRLAQQHGLKIIPPFDHPRVIAGQGTVAVELCRQTDMSKVDAIFCCVGGGGLVAGVAAYIKRIAPPGVKVIAVETFDADALAQSLEKGHRVLLNEVGLFSDGTAVRIVGEECFRLAQQYVDDVVRVTNDEICAAIKDVFEDTRSIPEPAGALSLAGMKRYIATHNLSGSGKTFIAIVSGANMNFGRLRFVAERAELGERREVLLSVEIPETPGSFLRLHNHIHPRRITEFSYRLNSNSDRAHICLSFLLSQPPPPLPESTTTSPNRPLSELETIIKTLEQDSMPAIDISGNELAKSHARYLVGGRQQVKDERIFRFEFPERPGALGKFLNGLQAGWNISLWHYRNHGADVGKVLIGVQVAFKDHVLFQTFLDELGYTYHEETQNPVYQQYLHAT